MTERDSHQYDQEIEPQDGRENLEIKRKRIEERKQRSLEFIDKMLGRIRTRAGMGDGQDADWVHAEEEWVRERRLIEEIFELGKENGILIDLQYDLIPTTLAKRLGPQRLLAMKEALSRFIPYDKIREHLKEINVQQEEAYLSLGCGGFFHDGVAEIPRYKTLDAIHPEDFVATLIHEAAGHPIGVFIQNLDPKAKAQLTRNYRKIVQQRALFNGGFGRVYPTDEMEHSFDQFIAELTKQYCLDGEALRAHIQNLSPELRSAYLYLYDFLKVAIYGGNEFGDKDIESLLEISEAIKSKEKASK